VVVENTPRRYSRRSGASTQCLTFMFSSVLGRSSEHTILNNVYASINTAYESTWPEPTRHVQRKHYSTTRCYDKRQRTRTIQASGKPNLHPKIRHTPLQPRQPKASRRQARASFRQPGSRSWHRHSAEWPGHPDWCLQ
jgi:hypothetical protein